MSSKDGIIPSDDDAGVFQLGHFVLSSGQESDWKVECDKLRPGDWDWAAYQMRRRYGYGEVHGVPSRRGGKDNAAELVRRLQDGVSPGNRNSLIVDDVYTHGGSMRAMRDELVFRPNGGGRNYMGCVVYARNPIAKHDQWVSALWNWRGIG